MWESCCYHNFHACGAKIFKDNEIYPNKQCSVQFIHLSLSSFLFHLCWDVSSTCKAQIYHNMEFDQRNFLLCENWPLEGEMDKKAMGTFGFIELKTSDIYYRPGCAQTF